ncbi:putative leucine-rich repeat-containing protein DDB_G0290503 [Planococcus citri]|uniref:putative leucine-rich repeat-containing protein DDB_G0290503 n=1 Tax=Planococcus citri TaxID=170843 RepID=UPI0031F94100
MHSKSYLHFTIFLVFLSISVHGFHVNNSDTHSISGSIRSTDLPENTSDSLSESFIELIKQLTGIQVYLETKTSDMEKRDIELRLREKEAKKREDGIKSLEQLFKQKEEYINKTAETINKTDSQVTFREAMVKQKEDAINKKETEVKYHEDLLKKRKAEVHQKGDTINKKETEVKNNEQLLKTREAEVNKKEVAINKKETEVKNNEQLLKTREAEVNQKEDTINKKETEVKNNEELLKTREKQLNEKENELEKSNADVRKRIEQLKQKEENIEKTETEIKTREKILKRQEKLRQKENKTCSIGWVRASNDNKLVNVLVGGQDSAGTLYVGRANHNGSLIPGYLSVDGTIFFTVDGHPYISYYDEHNYEVATFDEKNICRVLWVKASNGSVPTNAIVGGYDSHGENLYIGRAIHKGHVIPGKVQPSLHCLLIYYSYVEYRYTEYEVAVIGL